MNTSFYVTYVYNIEHKIYDGPCKVATYFIWFFFIYTLQLSPSSTSSYSMMAKAMISHAWPSLLSFPSPQEDKQLQHFIRVYLPIETSLICSLSRNSSATDTFSNFICLKLGLIWCFRYIFFWLKTSRSPMSLSPSPRSFWR